jgi:transcriptional regulator with XRE-family HTH domain
MTKAKELGTIYKMNRVERDLCMQAVASAIGISKATISRIERGRSIPSLKALSALNKFFGINITYDEVVKEPDKPDLKGWIQVTEGEDLQLVNLSKIIKKNLGLAT